MIKGMPSVAWALAALAVLCGEPNSARSENRPARIVSFNLCADQLLLTLADPSQIAGLSPYATDPTLSQMAEAAKPFKRLGWDAESVINLAPDLVLVGPSDRPMRAILNATGLRVVEVGLVGNLAAASRQAREIGALVGYPERGETLARTLEQAEGRLAAAVLRPPRTALVVERGGYAEGSNSLLSAMLTTAGLQPPPDSPGGFGGFVSMEQLLVDGPDILVMQDPPREARDQGALFIAHPALLQRYGRGRRIDIPARTTLCGGPAAIEGVNRLTQALTTLR